MPAKTKLWRIIDLINWGTDRFSKKGISNARLEMEWILCDILNCERIDLYVHFDNLMKEVELEQLRSMIKRRIAGEPFQHIIGKAPFYGRDFKVNHNVFVPRPETEIIIDRIKKNGVVSTLLDIGTGSGCLAITAVLENLANNVYATDVSTASLEVALDNLKLYGVKCIQLTHHDFLKQNFKTKFDLVVSNPPYIAKDDMGSLQSEVINYDPESALTDGRDGLQFYYRFAEQFDNLLNPAGYLLLEFGGNKQKISVEQIFTQYGFNTNFFKDLQGDWRVVEVRR